MKRKWIAVIDWNWTGHHPAYYAHFVLAMEELGLDILAMCPDPKEARRCVTALREGYGLASRADGQTDYRKLNFPKRIWGRLLRGSIGDMVLMTRHFLAIEGLARECQREFDRTLDLLFYACIYDADFQWLPFIRPFLRMPWAGLYLHAMSFRMPHQPSPKTGRVPRPETIFGFRLCRGIAILDEGIVSEVKTITGKPVVVFPELTDERMLPPHKQILANRMRHWADGRTVVGLFGVLQPSKGVMALLLASQHTSLSDVCFAIGGEMHLPLFSNDEQRTIAELLASSPNLWNHLMRIPDEAQLNSLLASCDVLYAAYLDFPHSSGILTKAAMLKKPVIVSNGYLMAERVKSYNMGEVVPQDNIDAIVGAISRLTRNPRDWCAANQPRWPDYMRENSFENLKTAISELLAGSR